MKASIAPGLTVSLRVGDPIADLADALDALAAADGRPEIARAARSLRQTFAGPSSINDDRAINDAWEMFVSGQQRTLWNAQLAVAGNDRSVAERLRRKMRAMAAALRHPPTV